MVVVAGVVDLLAVAVAGKKSWGLLDTQVAFALYLQPNNYSAALAQLVEQRIRNA